MTTNADAGAGRPPGVTGGGTGAGPPLPSASTQTPDTADPPVTAPAGSPDAPTTETSPDTANTPDTADTAVSGSGAASHRGQVRARVWWAGRSLRARLTLLATAVVALGLAAGSGLLFATLQRTQLATVERGATHTGEEVATMINAGLLPDPVPATVGSAVVQVIDAHGRVQAGSANADHLVPLLTPTELARARSGDRLIVSGDRVGLADEVLVVATAAGARDDRQAVVVAVSLRDVRHGLEALRNALYIGGPALLVLLGTLSWFVVGAALRPVDALRAGAEEISGAGGSRRLPVPRARDEMHRLAATLNDMLARLETASARQRQFVSDAAHELRSPLASIRTQVEVARRLGEWRDSTVDDTGPLAGSDRLPRDGAAGEGRAGRDETGPGAAGPDDADPLTEEGMTEESPAEESLADGVLADVDRLSRLIDDLLLLAKLDESGALPRRREPVDLVALTTELANGYVESRVPVTVDGSTGPAATHAWAVGDRDGLRRAFGNLVDNAVRHAATRVTVEVRSDDPEWTVVSVSDDGAGVPAKDRDRIFDRFIRLDDARDRDSGGSGLGLAIVRDLIRAHGGSVRLEDAEPGLRAIVVLPRTPAPAAHHRAVRTPWPTPPPEPSTPDRASTDRADPPAAH